MNLGGASKDEIALLIGAIAFVGVLLTALSNWFSASRSKYVDTITAQRIKWVAELRSDISEWISDLTELRQSYKRREPEEKRAEAIARAYRKLVLIHLKLNLRSPLDREIFSMMCKAIEEVPSGDSMRVQTAHVELVARVSDLLKDEWEAAKWESAGPIRRLQIWWKRVGRWDEHRRRWKLQSQSPSLPAPNVDPVNELKSGCSDSSGDTNSSGGNTGVTSGDTVRNLP